MKILILSESIAGSGHVVAANNIAKGIEAIYPTAEIKVDTALPKVSTFLEKWTSEAYMKTIRHASSIWGWAYNRDKEWSRVGKNLLRKYVASRLEAYLSYEKPDIVICTHAFCLGGLSELKQKISPSFKLGASLTDYCINHFWVFDEVDYYFVGAESLKQSMIKKYGLAPDRIHVTGIPIDPVFSVHKDRAKIRQRYGIPEDSYLILVSGGGLGIAPYEEILEALRNLSYPLYIIVILGKNKEMRRQVESAASTLAHPTLIFDYITNMSEWMLAADFMIGKPGGLTVSEALSCELPIFVYKPIPGQEERNTHFLLENQVAVRADNPWKLHHNIEAFLSRPEEIHGMRERIKKLGRPGSAVELGRIAIGPLENSNN